MTPVFAFALLSAVAISADASPIQCCSIIKNTHPNHVTWPGNTDYTEEAVSNYWSNTTRLHPSCVFMPDSAEVVSSGLRLFEQHECKFAIRSGGHTPIRGANNIDDGILLSTSRLNQMTLHDGYVSVGSGLRWGEVFDFLKPHRLAVVGGRVGEVGVAGLTLGCGLSMFSGKRGFACDNVKAYQIVISGGQVVVANSTHHSDLFWSLKGGTSNFGIVTRFDLYTHTDYQIYTATQVMGMEHWDELAEAIDNFTRLRSAEGEEMAISPKVQYVPIFGEPTLQVPLGSTILPSSNDSWSIRNGTSLALPRALADFRHLPYNESASTGLSVKSVADVLHSTSTPSGLRYELRVISFRSSLEMIRGIKTIVEEEFSPRFEDVKGLSVVLEFQPITKHNIVQGYAKGGNALGITEDRAPMIWLVMANSWHKDEDDVKVQTTGQRIVDRGQALARQLNLYEPFLFLNDAGVHQDPIATYGEESIRKLRKVKQKYDANGTFDRLLPGGFKLPTLQEDRIIVAGGGDSTISTRGDRLKRFSGNSTCVSEIKWGP